MCKDSEYGRVLKMSHAIDCVRSFYRLISTYRELGVFSTLSKNYDSTLEKELWLSTIFTKTIHLKSLGGFCMFCPVSEFPGLHCVYLFL